MYWLLQWVSQPFQWTLTPSNSSMNSVLSLRLASCSLSRLSHSSESISSVLKKDSQNCNMLWWIKSHRKSLAAKKSKGGKMHFGALTDENNWRLQLSRHGKQCTDHLLSFSNLSKLKYMFHSKHKNHQQEADSSNFPTHQVYIIWQSCDPVSDECTYIFRGETGSADAEECGIGLVGYCLGLEEGSKWMQGSPQIYACNYMHQA